MSKYQQLNPPVYRASTILFESTDAFLSRSEQLYDGFTYGLAGTPTTRQLEADVARIEGGARSVLVPSGLAALTHTLLAFCKAGDHALVVDCSYGPNRTFGKETLMKLGIDVEFFPSSAASIADRLRPETRMVILESPGYYTMEIQEIADIAREAHAVGALVAIDNSWGFGFSRMFDHGVDITCVALSKYASAGGDLCLGAITVRDEELYRELRRFTYNIGAGGSSDEAYLVLRSLPSLTVRLKEHAERGAAASKLLLDHPTVSRVINPALPGDAQHERFRRYFHGSNSLFSVIFNVTELERLRRMIDGFRVFRIGASWGSSHSLVSISRPMESRDIDNWPEKTFIVRFHIGFEDFDAVTEDLMKGLDRLSGG